MNNEGLLPFYPAEDHTSVYLGTTKREHFAALLASGLVSGNAAALLDEQFPSPHDLAAWAVKAADALLDELAK